MVPLPPGKRRDLLAALLRRRNDWVHLDVLAETLWGGAKYPSSTSGSIKTYMHQLRKMLPPSEDGQRLAGQGGAYRLTVDSGELDIDIFESLVSAGVDALAAGESAEAIRLQREALTLWRDTPEEDATDPVFIRHLDELRWTARYCLTDGLRVTGEVMEGITVLRAMLSEDPLREPTWERLIMAQRAAGWQVDALASYEQVRTILLDEFGAAPGSQLQGIYRALLAETTDAVPPPRLAPVPLSRAAPAPVPPRPPARPVAAVPPAPRRRARTVTAPLTLMLIGALLLVSGSSMAHQATWSALPRAADVGRTSSQDRAATKGAAQPKILFGLGPDAVKATGSPLMASGIGMITTWYHGPDQLSQFEGWRSDVIPKIYRSGRAVHVVVATWQDGTSIKTRFGRACGQPYPLSDEFVDDMRRLAAAFAGRADGPPLYISMFHGLQKLACANSGYLADRATTNYYLALKERYADIMKTMRQQAPNARIALNWDGWTASHDDPRTGAGRSMFRYFAEAMRASDFQSFSLFEPDGNAEELRRMVKALGTRGPVMVAYYGPHEDPVDVYQDDLRRTFTPETVSQLVADGLFAFSFRDDDLLRMSPETMTLASQIIRDYGHPQPAVR
nr:BTAD domain-containing putative transcriptional regulator [Nonomuraea guangzhouensis]